jgi:hypothetical protein
MSRCISSRAFAILKSTLKSNLRNKLGVILMQRCKAVPIKSHIGYCGTTTHISETPPVNVAGTKRVQTGDGSL